MRGRTACKNQRAEPRDNVFLEPEIPFLDAQEELLTLIEENPGQTVSVTYILEGKHISLSSTDYMGKMPIEYPSVLLRWIQQNLKPEARIPGNTYWFLNCLETRSLYTQFNRALFHILELSPKESDLLDEFLGRLEGAYMEILFTILPALTNLPPEERDSLEIGEWCRQLVNFSLRMDY